MVMEIQPKDITIIFECDYCGEKKEIDLVRLLGEFTAPQCNKCHELMTLHKVYLL
jgi:formylmethanofuran dehydrogenase subunit E